MTPKQIIAILQDQVGAAEKENNDLKAINADLVAALKHMLHWHDQLMPADILLAKNALTKAGA